MKKSINSKDFFLTYYISFHTDFWVGIIVGIITLISLIVGLCKRHQRMQQLRNQPAVTFHHTRVATVATPPAYGVNLLFYHKI